MKHDSDASVSRAIRVLGHPCVTVGNKEHTRFRTHRIPALLGYLAWNYPSAVHRKEAAAALWPDKEASEARHNLRQTLFLIQKDLGSGLVDVEGSNLTLASDIECDLIVLRSTRRDARAAGEFLAGLDDEWILEARADLGQGEPVRSVPVFEPFGLLRTRPRESLKLAVALTPSWVSAGRTRSGLAQVEDALAACKGDRNSALGQEALLCEGELAMGAARVDRASHLAHELLERGNRLSPHSKARLQLLLAKVNTAHQDYPAAHASAIEAWRTATAAQEPWIAADAAIRVTSFGRLLNRRSEALEFSQLAQEMATRTRDNLLIGQSLGARVSALRNLGRTDEAILLAKQAAAFMVCPERPGDSGLRLARFGRNLEGLGKLDAALETYRNGLEAIRMTDDEDALAECCVYLGDLLNRLGRPLEAEPLHEEAARLRRALGDKWGEGAALRGIGLAKLYIGDFQSAERNLERAKEILRRFGPLPMASTLAPLAEAQWRLRKLNGARMNISYALNILPQFDAAYREAQAPGDLLSLEYARRVASHLGIDV